MANALVHPPGVQNRRLLERVTESPSSNIPVYNGRHWACVCYTCTPHFLAVLPWHVIPKRCACSITSDAAQYHVTSRHVKREEDTILGRTVPSEGPRAGQCPKLVSSVAHGSAIGKVFECWKHVRTHGGRHSKAEPTERAIHFQRSDVGGQSSIPRQQDPRRGRCDPGPEQAAVLWRRDPGFASTCG